MKDFELLDLSLHTEEHGRLEVPLPDAGGPGAPRAAQPVALPEGAVLSIGLVFRLGREIDGVTFEDTHLRDGRVIAARTTMLGGFRAGGPYEVRLPPERLPVGRAHCGVHEMTGRFTDAEGHELAVEHHRLRIVHQPAAHKRWAPAPAAPSAPL
ncbi:hypothetical protein R6L23_17645 [Streptomyces sp. SR27]|uniref:hypothetical protein n=1 Tax=Streptomyces sp. SR27 TaxID=3076630 RepID=UPI00295C35D4|nr:hypothetical protein [Streptomyces sp. SR27]MDV9190011.1 hypothetical protein [Streptomyces sp. SR27]